MEIAIHLPPDVARRLVERWPDLQRRALEAVAVDAYREGILSSAEVGRVLGHTSRWETHALLKRAGADLDYGADELGQDSETLRDLMDE